MTKRAIVALAIPAAALAAFFGLRLHTVTPATPAVAAEKPAAAVPAVPVTAATVATADVPVVLSAIGTVQAFNMVTVKSRVDGQIVKIAFTEGQEVDAGAPLLQIDPRPLQALVEQAQATKEKDEAQLASAQTDLVRWAELVPQGVKSRQTYDQQKALVAQLQASVKADQAQIDTAKINLGFTDIRAPIGGRLGARLVDVGNMVRATDAAGLVTVAQLKPIFVAFTVPQENAHKVRERQAAGQLEVLAYGDDNATVVGKGKLTLIDNTIDQTTGTIRLKATFANADERLWPGQFVNIRLILNMRKGVPTVPAQTVQDGPTGSYAYVIKDDSTVERRPVEVSVVQDGVAVIAKGLAAGERVVTDGQYRLTEGAKVRLSEPAAKAAG